MSSDVRTYGGWRRAVVGGMGKFTLGQTIGLLTAGFAVVITNWLAGMWWAVGLGAVMGLVAALMAVRDKYGMNFFDRRGEAMRFRRARRRQTNLYRSGVLSVSRRSDGHCRLPGVLGRARLSEHSDAYRRPFAVVHHGDGHLTVVMAIAPTGEHLMDKEAVDQEVARFGLWIASLSDEVGVCGASVTVETRPDTGRRLRREVDSRMSPQAPQAARRIVDGVVERSGSAGSQIHTWATMSFDPAAMGAGARGRAGRAVADIATRLPGLTQTFAGWGAGPVHLMTAEEVKRMLRVAYDPDAEALFDRAAEEGMDVDLPFSEVGPAAADAHWDRYRHDSAVSCTWVMRRAPRGTVQSGSLRRLLRVSRDVERKRVTIIYRPMDPARAPDVVERDVDKAVNKRRMASRPTARMDRDVAQARQTSEEEAGGASITDFGMIITATVSGPDAPERIADARATVEGLSAASRLVMRPAWGCQDSAFALGLPMGLMPSQQALTGGW